MFLSVISFTLGLFIFNNIFMNNLPQIRILNIRVYILHVLSIILFFGSAKLRKIHLKMA